jgi:hypothetical protein
MLTDRMKYDRMDEATASLRASNNALGALSRELADLGMSAIGAVQLDGMTRRMDVWFDNIISDMNVRSRIIDAHERVKQLLAAVNDVIARLLTEHQRVVTDITALDAEREKLLTT